MTNRNLLLGRSKPSERLSREEIAALDQSTAPPAPPARPKPPAMKGGGQQTTRSMSTTCRARSRATPSRKASRGSAPPPARMSGQRH